MPYRVLARKYRPETFEEVLGQEHIVKTLTRSLENNRIGHAYIFSGPRGIGKTTTARLLAKAVNCEESDSVEPCNECTSCEQISDDRDVDVIEIDGASNNSVDQIRNLRENVQYAPAHNEKKVYIIDEVHMLSRSAFNALLKTLEEPPDHVIFVFATTEVDKVPDTILSRCQRFDFRLIPQKLIAECLEDICTREEIPAEPEALFLIAKFAGGSLRDAQSILDQMINFTGAGEEKITQQLVSDTWGLAPYDKLLELINAIEASNEEKILSFLHDHVNAGNDLMALISDLAEMFRNCLLLKETQDGQQFLGQTVPSEIIPQLEETAGQFTRTELSWTFEQLLELHEKLQQFSRFQLQLAEVTFVKLSRGRPRLSLTQIVDRLEKLEDGASGSAPTENTGQQPQKQESQKQVNKSKPKNKNQQKTESPDREPKAKPEESKPAPEQKQKTEEEVGANWEKILQAVPNPAQAYLHNSDRVTEDGEKILIWFKPGWQNHVEQLRLDKNISKIKAAIEEVTGQQREIEIKVLEEETSDSKETSSETNKTEQNQEEKRLLKQAQDIFDVESEAVQKLD